MSVAREIAKLCNGDGKEPKKSGVGYSMRCPCSGHGKDKHASAWIADGPNGLPGVKCFKGCTKVEIRSEIKRRGWWPDVTPKNDRRKNKALLFNSQYDYTYADGRPAMRVALYDHVDGGKKVPVPLVAKPVDPKDPSKGVYYEKSKGQGLPNILYNLPAIIAAAKAGKVIWDVEGEPKAKLLIDWGLHATSIYGGSGNIDKWKASEPHVYCKGAKFVVVPVDHDKAGFKIALQKCRHYKAHGIPVKFLAFNEFGEVREAGGLDVKDWAETGRGDKEKLIQRALDLPLWEPDPDDDGFDDLFEGETKLPDGANVVNLRGDGPAVSPFSESATADQFVEDHKGDVRWVTKFQLWYWWNGKNWEPDRKGYVRKLMKDSVLRLHEKLKVIPGLDRDTLSRWFKKATNKVWLSNSLVLAQPDMDFDYSEFDNDPYILNCKNGIIDLKTGELIFPHDKSRNCSLIIPHDYLGLDCYDYPLWASTLNYAFGNTQEGAELKTYIARVSGYSALGLQKEKKFFLCWGPQGDNLKSTITDGIRFALGPYANAADKRLILLMPNENKWSDAGQLQGLRVAFLDEIYRKDRIDDGKFRKLVSGGDGVKAAPVFKDPFDINPIFTLWAFGNEKPQMDSTGNQASWNRFVVIPFRHQMPADKMDREFRFKLRKEASQILSWIVRGCLEYQAIGLAEPPVVEAARKEYREEMDPLKECLEETCDIPGQYVRFGAFYNAYLRWADESGISYTYTKKRIGQELEHRGFERGSHPEDNSRIYRGLELKYEYMTDDAPRQTKFKFPRR